MFTTSLFKKALALMVMMYAAMSFAAGEANTAADKPVASSTATAKKGITQSGIKKIDDQADTPAPPMGVQKGVIKVKTKSNQSND